MLRPTLLPIVAAAAAAGIFALFVLARSLVDMRRARLDRRLKIAEEPESAVAEAAASKHPPSWAGNIDNSFDRMIQGTALGITPEQALGILSLSGVGLAALAYFWRGEWWLTAAAALVGMAVPFAVFMMLRSRARQQIQDQLPDALHHLARALRAGLSLEQGLAMVGEHGPRPIAYEFQRATRQTTLGLAIPVALQLAARRIGLLDFDAFVSVVALHGTTGGDLPLLLDRLSASVRDRNQYRGYFRAATAQGRITGIVISSAVPVILLVYILFQPQYGVEFFRSTAGWTVLGASLLMEAIGVLWLYLLLRVDY